MATGPTHDELDQGEASEPPSRKVYAAPRLREYGLLRDLTAGGSGMMAEGVMMTSMIRFP